MRAYANHKRWCFNIYISSYAMCALVIIMDVVDDDDDDEDGDDGYILKQVRCFLLISSIWFRCVCVFITCSLWCCRRTFCICDIIITSLTLSFGLVFWFSVDTSVCLYVCAHAIAKPTKRVNYDTRWGYWRPTWVAITQNALLHLYIYIYAIWKWWKKFQFTYGPVLLWMWCWYYDCCWLCWWCYYCSCCLLLLFATPSSKINTFIN